MDEIILVRLNTGCVVAKGKKYENGHDAIRDILLTYGNVRITFRDATESENAFWIREEIDR